VQGREQLDALGSKGVGGELGSSLAASGADKAAAASAAAPPPRAAAAAADYEDFDEPEAVLRVHVPAPPPAERVAELAAAALAPAARAQEDDFDMEPAAAEPEPPSAPTALPAALPGWLLASLGSRGSEPLPVRFSRPPPRAPPASSDAESEEEAEEEARAAPPPLRGPDARISRAPPPPPPPPPPAPAPSAQPLPPDVHPSALALSTAAEWEAGIAWGDEWRPPSPETEEEAAAAAEAAAAPSPPSLADMDLDFGFGGEGGADAVAAAVADAPPLPLPAAPAEAAETPLSFGRCGTGAAVWEDQAGSGAAARPAAPPPRPRLVRQALALPSAAAAGGRALGWRNIALLARGWEAEVAWEAGSKGKPAALLLDLNDPGMTFALLEPGQGSEAAAAARAADARRLTCFAAATVLPPELLAYAPLRARAAADARARGRAAAAAADAAGAAEAAEAAAEAAAAAGEPEGEAPPPATAAAAVAAAAAQRLLAPLNISLDAAYAARGSEEAIPHKNALTTRPPPLRVAHALPALMLETAMPYLYDEDARLWHRPRVGPFLSPSARPPKAPSGVARVRAAEGGGGGGGGTLLLFVLPLREVAGCELRLELSARAPGAELLAAVSAAWPEHGAGSFSLFPTRRGEEEGPPGPIDPALPLNNPGQRLCNGRVLWLVCTRPLLLANRVANAVPGPDRPRAPPAAFQNVSDLTARDGHLFLVEYAEEHPTSMSFPGMGAQRVCWYRRRSPGEPTPRAVTEAARGAEVIPLEPQAASPFLPELQPGSRQMCLETKMARCSLWEHAPQPGDFVLIRSATGRLFLRAATRTGVVGHCEPQLAGAVPMPRVDRVADFQRRRMELTLFRKLRACRAAGRPEQLSLSEVREELPYHWEKGSVIDKLVRSILRQDKPGSDTWRRQPGVDLPSEEVLRELVSPEAVCTYESMQAAHRRLKDLGVVGLGLFNPKTALSTAQNALPRDPQTRTLAALIRLEMSLMPWAQTSAFIDVLLGRGALQMDTSRQGAGRRGHYIHFCRKAVRNAEPDEKRARALELQPKAIQGTSADLRKLSMAECAAELRRLGLNDEEIVVLQRWDRVRLIRHLSADAIVDGGELRKTQARWARVERQSAAYLQQSNKEAATTLFARMERMFGASSLGGRDEAEAAEAEAEAAGEADMPETDSDDEDLARELETAILEEALAARAKAAADAAAARERARAEAEAERREHAQLAAILGGGDGADAGGEAAAEAPGAPRPGPGPPGAPGTRLRLRRTVTVYYPGGRVEKQEDVLTQPEVLAAYTAAKDAEGDCVDAVLGALGPDGFPKLPFPLRGVAEAAAAGRFMRPDLKARRDKEAEKRLARKNMMAEEQYERVRAAGQLNATVLQAGVGGPGGVIAPPREEAILKVRIAAIGTQLASKLKPAKQPKQRKQPGEKRYRRTPEEMARARGLPWPPADASPHPAPPPLKRAKREGEIVPTTKLTTTAAAAAAAAKHSAAAKAAFDAAAVAPVPKRVSARDAAVRAAHAAGRSEHLAVFAVNDVLADCIARALKSNVAFEITFGQGVNTKKPGGRAFCEDYLTFCAERDNLSISKMRTKTTAAQPERSYASAEQMLDEAARLAASVRAYHDPGPGLPAGKYANKSKPPLAAALEAALRKAVQESAAELARARMGPWTPPPPLPGGEAGGGEDAEMAEAAEAE